MLRRSKRTLEAGGASSSRAHVVPPHRPEESFAFRLGMLSNLIAMPFLAEHGIAEDLTLPEWRMMQVLDVYPQISISEICRRTGMHKMQVSRAVQRSLRLRRVVCTVNPEDARSKLVTLTTDGRALCNRLYPGTAQREGELVSALTEDQRHALGVLLDDMIAHMQRIS